MHVNGAPIVPGNENDENDEKGRPKRKRRGGGKGKLNSFLILLMNTGRKLRIIKSNEEAERKAENNSRVSTAYKRKRKRE